MLFVYICILALKPPYSILLHMIKNRLLGISIKFTDEV